MPSGRINLEFVNIYKPPKGGLVDFTDQRLCRVKMTFGIEVTQLPERERLRNTNGKSSALHYMRRSTLVGVKGTIL